MIIIATASDEYVIDLRQKKIDCSFFREWLAGRTVVMQNAKFDMRMMEKVSKPLPEFTAIDIAVIARLVNNQHLSYSLADQARRYGMEKDKTLDEFIKKNKLYVSRTTATGEQYKVPMFYAVPDDILHNYARLDARITYDLYQIYLKELPEVSKSLWDMERELTWTCYRMERKGVKVDREYCLGAIAHYESLILEAKKQFHLQTGYVHDNKKATLIKAFEAAGDRVPLTEKGNPKLDAETLEKFKSPVAALEIKIREYEKLISTYYKPFLDHAAYDGRIHPSMWQGGTATGRFSYSNPNMQNIPKDGNGTYSVRKAIVPSEGNVLVSIDYSQQEYRMMLAYANERHLIDEVMAGKDVHQSIADIVGVSRKEAKVLNFAILYGAGPDKIAAMLGITHHEASVLRRDYLMRLPRVDMLIQQVISKARHQGEIRTWAGRMLRAEAQYAYALPNHLIQGGAADVCKTAMLGCGKVTDSMIVQIHDQLVFDMHPSELVKIPEIVSIMESAFPEKNGMRLTVDVSWSTLSLDESDLKKGIPCQQDCA
jgi:DNA polymerase-1